MDLTLIVERALDAASIPLSRTLLWGVPVKRLPLKPKRTVWPEEYFRGNVKKEPYNSLRQQVWGQK